MYNLENLKELLDSGVITNEEYGNILKRISVANNTYDETWGDVLNGFYDWCINKYAKVTAKGYKTCLYKFVNWVTKENDNEKSFRHKFKIYSFMDVNNLFNDMQKMVLAINQ